ncbi:predicted protein [Sclerotinia sclerotiorum 1980 UF-70]|uniref:Uncharacterized protein n=1 Tax=Sclerotinia sclerotiorum (strain ATCC 18683 / 1980 / Ss-1) TaxID=665079 RepID=A7EGG5_SCLS1|nr:predicted protein [Sclerotinia sclerotiorum 1980 UF-70]EDO01931.1 predicted protein [Sclerotinia sclerotiorum 1980 UF-70]
MSKVRLGSYLSIYIKKRYNVVLRARILGILPEGSRRVKYACMGIESQRREEVRDGKVGLQLCIVSRNGSFLFWGRTANVS